MITRYWVGVSGFSYASWKGTFYPRDMKPDGMLQAYSTKLNSVEVNSSFYSMPNEKTTLKWAHLTPEYFRFSFKANRRITHFMKLRNVKDETRYFMKGLEPLKEKLGCVLFQLPPFLKQDVGILETFLSENSGALKLALEFRHESWFTAEAKKLLEKYNAALCVADTEDMKPVFENTADFAYFRLRHDEYSKTELKTWAERIGNLAERATDCFVYFKHDETGKAANVATEFVKQLGG